MLNEFYVTLLSNNSCNKYPQNVLSSFTNYIDIPISLTGSWDVGICEMYFNKFLPSFAVNCSNEVNENLIEPCNEGKAYKKIDLMFIHTDIIKPRNVGDQMIRCLKVLPANAKQDEYVKFGRVEYYPLEFSYIRSISVQILNSDSDRIAFHESFVPTMLTLHFRKKYI